MILSNLIGHNLLSVVANLNIVSLFPEYFFVSADIEVRVEAIRTLHVVVVIVLRVRRPQANRAAKPPFDSFLLWSCHIVS